MKKSIPVLELCLFAYGTAPIGIVGSFYWITKRRVPDMFLYALLVVLVSCIVAGIVKRLREVRNNTEESGGVMH